MADSPNSTQNREANSEEGGSNHSKTVDMDSKVTASKPSTEYVGQQKSCSSDKDDSSSRAEQNDDDNDENNSNGNFGDKKSEDVHPPCGDTSTTSNFKGSTEAPADQGENRERANSKDGEKMINNEEVSSETNTGSHNENDMEEMKNEDDLMGATSKPSTQAVSQQKSSSSDKDSSSSTAGQSDDDDDNSNLINDDDKCNSSADQHIAENDVEFNVENKEEEMKENKSEDPNALNQELSLALPLMKANIDLRRPKEGTIRKFEDQTEQNKNDKKQQKMQKEKASVHKTSNDSFDETKSEDVQLLCDDISTDDNKEFAANSDEKGSNKAPADQEENRGQNNLKDGENKIDNVKRSSETHIGDENNDMEEIASNDKDDSKDTTSKPSTEAVVQENRCSSDKESSSSRTERGKNRERANLRNGENKTNNVEVTSETNISDNKLPINYGEIFKGEDTVHRRNIKEEKMLYDKDGRQCPRLEKPGEVANVTDDPYNETNQRHPQHSSEVSNPTLPSCNIETDLESEQISVSYGNDFLKYGQFRMDESDMIQGKGGTELHVSNRYLYDRGVNESEIPLLDLPSDDLPGTYSQELPFGTPRYNAQTGESVHSQPFIQDGNQIYQLNANGFNQHFDNDDNDQVGIGNNLPAAGGPSSPNDPDRDRLRNELIAKDQQIAELLAQIADLRMRERRNKDAIVNTEYEKNSLRRERDEARKTISTLTMTNDGLIDEVTGLEENKRILEERLHTTEEDNVTKDANIDTIRSKNSELQANCETLSENLTAAKKKCLSLEANQRRLDEKVQCLEKDLEKLDEENTAKSVEISSLKESCGTLKESEIRHRGECDKLRKAYDEEKDKTRFMEDRMNSLSGRVDTLEAETEQKDRMIHRKESARQAANEAMQKSQDENQVLCEQLRDLQSLQVQLEQEKAKNHAATEQLIALRQQLSGMDTMQRNIHIWWEEYRLAMNERTQEKADYETCRRRLQTLESELVYVKEERDSLRETTRVDQIEKDRLDAHKHDLTTKLQNQVGQITNMSEEVRNRREAMDTYRREKENLKDRSFELERSLLTAERQIEGLRRDISDRDRDILNLRAQFSDVSDPRDGDGDDGGPGHGSGGHGKQGGSTPGETNSGQQGCFPNIQSSTVHYRPQTPSNSVGLREQQNQSTPTSSVFGFPMPTSFTFTAPSSSSTPLRPHLSGNQGGPSFFGFSSPNSST